MNGSDFWALVTVIGMTAVTVVTRCFFFLSARTGSLPRWAQRGLQYAPIAALAAVIVPEIVMTHGQLIGTWLDARLFAVVAATAWYVWRRGLLGTIMAGMTVYLPLHLALGF